jgi:hypothetical protein
MKFKMIILMILGLVLAGVGSALGSTGYMDPFNTANVPAGRTAYNCGVCHTTSTGSSSARVQFGTDWARLRGTPINYSVATNNALAILDSDGDGITNLAEIQANTNPGVANSPPPTGDTTLPVVSTFTIPASSTSLTVAITALSATDNVAVTGYLVNESALKPAAGNWSASPPASYTFLSAGAKTLYAWARDAAGNVSNPLSPGRTVNITLPTGADTTPPTVTGFTLSGTAGSLTVSITTFSASDDVGVTGYLVNENAAKPAANPGGWTAAAPTGYTFTTAGAKTLYGWAKDAAGNVSNSLSRTITVTSGSGSGVDVESPDVMEFTLPLTSTSLTVPIVAFRAIDNIAPTAYLITTTPTSPAANASGWSATPPTSYTFTSAGAKTLYGWAKDAAGNVSESVWDNVEITLATDQTAPTVTEFLIPSETRSLTVPINSFKATDNVGVTGYMVTTSSTKPGASSSNWKATPPASYSFTSTGTKRLYPWVKDAAGNVSASWSGNATVEIED